MGDQNVLYTTPSGELITARRDSRAKFLRLEKAQLKAYAGELESSLGASKWVLKELGTASALLDKQFLERILNSLKAENAAVEERIQRIRIEKSEALLKSEHFSHQISDFLRREAADEDPLEVLTREKRAIHAEKELKVQAIDARCNYLTQELKELQTSVVQTPTAEATDLMLCDKFARLKEIYEKLLKELEKTENGNEELEQRQQELTAQLEQVNTALVRPVPRHQLAEARQVCPRAVFQDVQPDTADQAPPALLTKQLEVLQSNQQKRTISQLLALPTGAFQSSGEEKYALRRLTHEVAKLKDRVKDAQVKIETLADQLQSSKRQHADLEQDHYRLGLVRDSIQRHAHGDAFGRRGKAVSGLPPTPRRRKKARANSNPLEYAENVCKPSEQPPVLGMPEISDNEVEMDLEMPSIINGSDQDEFLQGDSFLLDALHL